MDSPFAWLVVRSDRDDRQPGDYGEESPLDFSGGRQTFNFLRDPNFPEGSEGEPFGGALLQLSATKDRSGVVVVMIGSGLLVIGAVFDVN